MKTTLVILMFVILLVSCGKRDSDHSKEAEERSINNSEKTADGKLSFINSYQELLLHQQEDKCGEWGGDIYEIRIYKSKHKEEVLADFKKIIIDCKDPYSEKKQPEIMEVKAIKLNNWELNLVQESIVELVNFKLTTEQQFSHSGIRNCVTSKDSTLFIENWPSFHWPKFRELLKQMDISFAQTGEQM